MTQRSKAYRAAAEKIDRTRLYAPLEAIRLAKQTSTTTYDATLEVAFRLGVDPRKADQMVRGTVNLPHGTGKTARVLVFATGERAEQAREAGADEVGGDELIEKVAGGYTDFDAAVATPDLMGKIEFRVDKHANLHFIIGKVSFEDVALVENYAAALDEVLRLKPASSKGRYIMKAVVTTTMGPSVPLDQNRTRNLMAEDDVA